MIKKIILLTTILFLITIPAKSEVTDCSKYDQTSKLSKFKNSKTLIGLFVKKNKSKEFIECQKVINETLPLKKIERSLEVLINLESKYNVKWNDKLGGFTGADAKLANKNAYNLINKRKMFIDANTNKTIDCTMYKKVSDNSTMVGMMENDKNSRRYSKCQKDKIKSEAKPTKSWTEKFTECKSLFSCTKKNEGKTIFFKDFKQFKNSKSWSEYNKKTKN